MAFSYFFRDLLTLETLRDYALPDLKTRRYIHIWDAGCAMGAEPYTLAMILRENTGYMYFRNIRIKATDMDGSNLFGKIIAKGEYPWEHLERIPRELFEKYFIPAETAGWFQISEEIRHCVSFQKHDLLSLQPVGQDFAIILCKNVLLHFRESERVAVIEMFHGALAPGGYFVTEQTQKLPGEVKGLFEPVVSHVQMFRKI